MAIRRKMAARAAAAALRAGTAAIVVGAGLATPGAFAQQGSAPMPVDQRIVTGKLDNGLAYMVRRHANPPGRSALYLHIQTGSLNETDAQRGLAHFIEHMVFNGSENFPPGSVIDFFQSLGLTFGQHQNASTGFDRTIYELEMPDNEPGTLDKGLRFFADVATKALLLQEEIDKERPIILREKGSRLSAAQRVQEAWIKQIAPGSTLGDRLPIGVEETLNGATRQDFLDYYQGYYVPANMTVMVVADMDEAQVVEQIRAHFGSAPTKARPQARPVGVKPDDKPRAIVVTDDELTRATVQVMRVSPARAPVTTIAQAREELVETLAFSAFNRRLRQQVERGEASFLGASASQETLFRAMTFAAAQGVGEPGKWREILGELGTEVARASQHGFEESEIALAREEIMATLDQMVAGDATVNATAILSRWGEALTSGEPVVSAADLRRIVGELAPGIGASEASGAFARAFSPNLVYSVMLPSQGDVPTREQLVELGEGATGKKVEARSFASAGGKLMEAPPTPGKVVERAVHEPTQFVSAWLDNGVRVHHRAMDYKKNDASVVISLYGATLHETPANRGITQAAARVLARPATKGLTSSQVGDILSPKKVSVGGGASNDVLRLAVSGNPEDLETGMQLAHLLLTQPVVEPAAFEQWRTQQRQALDDMERTPALYFGKIAAETIYPAGEVRVQPLTRAQVDALSVQAAQRWLEEMIAVAPIEVTIVGDISRDRALELATTYLGSLPKRERITTGAFADKRRLAREGGPRTTDRTLKTDTPQGIVLAGFYGPDEGQLDDVRAMRLASRVMTTRMIQTLREKEGLVYGTSARLEPGTTYPGFGTFAAAAPTEPSKVPTLARRIMEMYDEFAQGGPTPEELDVAKRQVANEFDTRMKEPSFWLGVSDNMTYAGNTLDQSLEAPAAYAAITPEQVRDAFRKYSKAENRVSVTLQPEGGATPTTDHPAEGDHAGHNH